MAVATLRAGYRGVSRARLVRASPPSALDVVRARLWGAVLGPIVRRWCHPFVAEGAERLSGLKGGVLLVANHASHLDAPAVLAALPPALRRRTEVAAAADYFYRSALLGALASVALGTFPFQRRGAGLSGLMAAARRLEAGRCVLLFPEGSRSADGGFGEFRSGAAWLLRQTGATVVPVGIVGTAGVMPRGARWPRRGPVAVRIDKPWRPDHGEHLQAVTSALQARIAELIGTHQ